MSGTGSAPTDAPVAPVQTPAETIAPSPAIPVAPTPEPAPAELPPAGAAAATEQPTSLLTEAGKKPDAPAVAAAATPTAEPVAPVAAPVFNAFTLPEGVTLEADKVGAFTEMLGKFEVENKGDHAAVQKLGQQMVDMYIAEQTRQAQAQQDAWVKVRDGWKDQFTSDPEMGGNRQNTTLSRCGAMIEQYGGTAAQQDELRSAFRITGMGDHPALIRLLANVGKALGEGTPVPAIVPRSPTPVPKSQRRYATSMNGAS